MPKEDFKKELREILELVKLCPQELQPKCFELLMADALENRESLPPRERQKPEGQGGEQEKPRIPAEIEKRMSAFAAAVNLSLQEVLRVYAVDDLGNVTIEVTDLRTAKTAQKQRRLALLIGGRHQFLEGSFDVPVEELRELCVTYSAYDPANFMAHLKNSKDLFANFKPNVTNKLSPKGKSQLGAAIKQLNS